MRLKQQSFLDKYLEKIILAVAVLVAGGIFYFYIWANPFAVSLTPNRAQNWEDVEKEVEDKGRNLDREVRRTEPAEPLKVIKIPDYEKRFWDRYEQKLVHSKSYPPIVFGPPGAAELWENRIIKIQRPKLIAPNAATDIKVASNYHVFESDPNVLAHYTDIVRIQYEGADEATILKIAQGLAKEATELAAKRNPRDFPTVTISAKIDPEARRKLYEAVTEEEGRMPRGWYENLLQFVTEIEVQRQTLDSLTGQWPTDESFEIIKPLPGSLHYILREYYIKPVETAKTSGKADSVDPEGDMIARTLSLFEVLGVHSKDLVEPEFLPVKPHRPWAEPDTVILQLTDEEQRKLFDLNQKIKKAEAERRSLQARAGVAQDGTGATFNRGFEEGYPEGPSTVRPPAGTPTPPRTGTPPRAPTPPRPGTPAKAPASNADQLKERIKVVQEKLQVLYQDKDAIINKPDPNAPVEPGGEGNIRRPTPRQPFPDEGFVDPTRRGPGVRPPQPRFGPDGLPIDPRFQPEDFTLKPIKLWAHDVTAEPGKTYRYRIVYRVINPLFNKETELHEDLKAKGKELELASLPSKWSEAVTIDPLLQFFVEDVNTNTNTASFGIYRIFNGNRIYRQFTARPGDPIGKSNVAVDLFDELGNKTPQSVNLQVPAVLVDVKSPARAAGAISVRGPISVLIAYLKDGEFEVRDLVEDQNNVNRKRMNNEANNAVTTIGEAGAPLPTPPGTR
ncbi:MAG: hypothetical protein WD768_00295 [Phycisphaeraceae bacterium]